MRCLQLVTLRAVSYTHLDVYKRQLLIVTLAGREFIKNHKKESNDKSSTNVSENTCEDIPDTSISDTCVACLLYTSDYI